MKSYLMAVKPRTQYTAGAALTVLLLLFIMLTSCQDAATKKQVQAIAVDSAVINTNNNLQTQNNAANAKIDALSTHASQLDSEVSRKNAQIAMLQSKINALNHKNARLSKKIKKDDSFIASIKNELNDKQRAYADELGVLKADKDKLITQLDDLMKKYTSVVALGSVLHASNVRMEAIHLKHNGKKEKKTVKARKLDLLRVKFDIDENRIAENGTKKLYIVITAPDGKVLKDDVGAPTFDESDGTKIGYSVLKQVSLMKDKPVKDVTVDWKHDVEHEKGTYAINIYNGGYKIGYGSVALR